MVWHIFLKDLRLLRLVVLMVAAMHCGTAALRAWLDTGEGPQALTLIASVLPLLCISAMMALIAVLMHTDAIPGTRQDWLVRPIRRTDLLLAKLLFVVLAVQMPLLCVDAAQGYVEGFSPEALIGAACARNASVFCCFSLPAMMIGAVTRNLSQALVTAVASTVMLMVIFEVGAILLLGMKSALGGTGLAWFVPVVWEGLALIGAAIVLGLQFFRRSTLLASCVIAVCAGLVLASAFMPWRFAFALQQRLSVTQHQADPIAFAFHPELGPFQLPAGEAVPSGSAIYFPLRVTGVPADAIAFADRTDIRVTDVDGNLLYTGKSNLSIDGMGSFVDAKLELRQRESSDEAIEAHQRIFLPAEVFAKLRRQPVKLQLDYSLTLLRADAQEYFLPAKGGHQSYETFGICTTRVDDDGDDVDIHCIGAQPLPRCFTTVLEDMSSGTRNPEVHRCNPYYAPFSTQLLPDALSRVDGSLPFFDTSGLTHYPINGSKLAESRVTIKTYSPREHFTRHLETSAIRLSEWSQIVAP